MPRRVIQETLAKSTRRLITLDEAIDSNAAVCGAVRTEFGGLAPRVTRDLGLRRDIEKGKRAQLSDVVANSGASGSVADTPT